MHKIGSRIRTWREERNISREQLAELADLTVPFISALEEDDLYPSIGPLQKVARALGVRLGTFMDDQVTKDPIIMHETDHTEDLTMQIARGKKPSFHYTSLAKGKSDRNMEPFLIQVSPEEDEAPSSHQGEEFMYVLEGELKVLYGKKEHILKAGDSIYYNSIVPHHVGANGGEARILAVIYYPI